MPAKHIRHTIVILAATALPGVVYADELSTVHNCSKEAPVYGSDEILTQEERIRQLDEAFDRALTKFSKCALIKPATSSNNGAAANAANASGEQTQSQREKGAAGKAPPGSSENPPAEGEPQKSPSEATGQPRPTPTAVNSRGLSGDDTRGSEENVEAGSVPAPVSNQRLSGDEPRKPEEDVETASGADRHQLDDIPPANTDDEKAAQLRRAAKVEQDPQKQIQRWNEYRRYRGFPEWEPHGGGTPESNDLPSADNDDAFAQQLRQVAETEKNPETKARLWEEYRRYKGLPEKSVPQKDQ